jgi:hypothetical protein
MSGAFDVKATFWWTPRRCVPTCREGWKDLPDSASVTLRRIRVINSAKGRSLLVCASRDDKHVGPPGGLKRSARRNNIFALQTYLAFESNEQLTS